MAYCGIVFDGEFRVNDVKVVQTGTGKGAGVFVAMPSRRIRDHCVACSARNDLQAKYCNQCGRKLGENRARTRFDSPRPHLYQDVAHPIDQACRRKVDERVLAEYAKLAEEARMGATMGTAARMRVKMEAKAK